jgi:acid phosphatase type 7
MSLRTLPFLFALALAGLAANPEPPFSRSPYVQSASPTRMHVVWRTDGPVEPVVRFGTDPSNLDGEVSASDITVRASLGTDKQEIPERWKPLRTSRNLGLPKLHSAPIGTFQYEARIKGLKADTTYHYAVYDGTRRLTPADSEHRFRTQPEPGTRRPYRFWVIGDGGTGRSAQKAVFDRMRESVQADGRPLDFWIHVGDMAYGTGRDVEFQTRYFESYAPLLRNTVCWPSMGNHEGHTSKGTTGVGPYYDAYVVPTRAESCGLASGTEAYYSFVHGNIHFICLDSHDLDRKPDGAMARWLKADLEKAKSDWLVAFWHHPPYTKGSHDSDKEKDLIEMRHHILPILEAGGVDLVLTGHSHVYERSMLIDGAYSTNATTAETFVLDDGDGDPAGDGAYRKSAGLTAHAGVVHVVTGNAGARLGRNGTSPIMRRTIVEHGSVLVEVDGDTLRGRMINLNGTERDTFALVKSGKVPVQRLSLPWQPPEYKKPASSPRVPNEAPLDTRVLVAAGAEWSFRPGPLPGGSDWTRLGFDSAGWKTGKAPFGHGEGRFATPLASGPAAPRALQIRREFNVVQADRITEMGLWIDYSDGFVAFINGHEVARVGVGRSFGRNAQGVSAREDSGRVYVDLRNVGAAVKDGVNVLAIECHLAAGESQDLRLDPELVAED